MTHDDDEVESRGLVAAFSWRSTAWAGEQRTRLCPPYLLIRQVKVLHTPVAPHIPQRQYDAFLMPCDSYGQEMIFLDTTPLENAGTEAALMFVRVTLAEAQS